MAGRAEQREQIIQRVKEIRAQAIEHTRQARRLANERRDLMQLLIDDGVSQADIARELGVTRQAIQKMLAVRPAAASRRVGNQRSMRRRTRRG